MVSLLLVSLISRSLFALITRLFQINWNLHVPVMLCVTGTCAKEAKQVKKPNINICISSSRIPCRCRHVFAPFLLTRSFKSPYRPLSISASEPGFARVHFSVTERRRAGVISEYLREVTLARKGEDRCDLSRAVVGVGEHVFGGLDFLRSNVIGDRDTNFNLEKARQVRTIESRVVGEQGDGDPRVQVIVNVVDTLRDMTGMRLAFA